MKAFIVIAALMAVAHGSVTIQKIGHGPSTLVRAPAHDSASIESHRLGGNFAYATAEAHAYAQITPEISEATHPVAETIHTHIPAAIAHVKPAPIVTTHHASRPIYQEQPILAKQPIIGVVGEHTEVIQPVIQKTYHQPAVAIKKPIVAAPAPIAHQPIGYAAAPAPIAHQPLGYAPAPAPIAPQPLGYAAAQPLPYAYANGLPIVKA